jgi:hypothetical protein
MKYQTNKIRRSRTRLRCVIENSWISIRGIPLLIEQIFSQILMMMVADDGHGQTSILIYVVS